MHSSAEHDTIVDELQSKIMKLHTSIWERRADWKQVLTWLGQFEANPDPDSDEQLLALRLLSNFMYFGAGEIRALLRSLYRDTYRPNVALEVRKRHNYTCDENIIGPELAHELQMTRFVALGNPSESSALLLYFFRQENQLPKDLFIHSSEIFDLTEIKAEMSVKLRDPKIRRYVFIDDLCGSGHQGLEYSTNIVTPLRSLKSDVQTYYYPLFGLTSGIENIRSLGGFDVVTPVVELDETFQAFSANSRLFTDPKLKHLLPKTEAVCVRHGQYLWPANPLGYDNGQLYIGFAHNTPDNSLPIFWSDTNGSPSWVPIFKRYPKVFW